MVNALQQLTIGHWAQNGKVNEEHIHGDALNVIEHASEDEQFRKIVSQFSFEGNTVINMSGDYTLGEYRARFILEVLCEYL